MNSELRIGRITTAQRTTDGFCVVKVVPPTEPGGPQLLAVVAIHQPWFSAAQVGNQIISALTNTFRRSDGAALPRFESAVRAVNETLQLLFEQGQTEWVGKLDAALVTTERQAVHFATAGAIRLILARSHKLMEINELSADTPDSPIETFNAVTSGELQLGDHLLVAPPNITELSQAELLEVLELPARISIRQLAKPLQRTKQLASGALVIEVVNPQAVIEDAELPDTVYLDQPLEAYATVLRRYVNPMSRAGKQFLLTLITVQLPRLIIHSRRISEQLKHRTAPQLNKTRASLINFQTSYLSPLTHQVSETARHHPLTSQISRPAVSLAATLAPLFEPLGQFLWSLDHLIERRIVHASSRARRVLFLPILAVLLLVGVYLNVRYTLDHRALKAIASQNQVVTAQAAAALAQARADQERNPTAATNEVVQSLQAIAALPPAQITSELLNLQNQLQDEYDTLTGSVRLKDPRATYQLHGSVNQFTLFDSTVVVPQGKKLLTHRVTATESGELGLIGDQLGEITSLATTQNSLLLTTTNRKVLRLAAASGPIEEVKLATPDGTLNEVKAIATFGPHLFVLDTDNHIWRHNKTAEGLGDRIAYITNDSALPKQPVSLAIDGFVYLLESDGSIIKYLKGAPQTDLTIRNLPSPLTHPLAITTDADSNNLYLLDAGSSSRAEPARIVVLEKDGRFVRQLLLREKNPTDFVVSEKASTVWISEGGKVSEYSL